MLVLPAACLRYDLAIPIPDDDMEARALAALSFFGATMVSLVYTLAIYGLSGHLGAEFLAVLDRYGWMIPLTVWAAAIFSLTQFWAVRVALYRQLAIAHVSRGLIGAGTQIGLGLAGLGALGLILGQSIYMGLGSFLLCLSLIRREGHHFCAFSPGFLAAVARKHWRFPAFSVPEAMLDSAGVHLPMLLIISISGPEAGGILFLAQRVTSIPVGIIGGALSRVYLGEARSQLAAGTLLSFTGKMVRNLFLMAAMPFLIMFFGAPLIFDAYLSSEWSGAARVLQLILPAAFIQFCIVPVSTVFHLKSRQFEIMMIQVCGLVLQVGSIVFCFLTSIAEPIVGLAVGSAIYYTVYAICIYLVARS